MNECIYLFIDDFLIITLFATMLTHFGDIPST